MHNCTYINKRTIYILHTQIQYIFTIYRKNTKNERNIQIFDIATIIYLSPKQNYPTFIYETVH